jgi:hypothetical protein
MSCHYFGRLGVAFVVCGLWHTNSLANGASCPGTSSRDLELGFMGSWLSPVGYSLYFIVLFE